jgi:hypothetical protein
MPPSNCLDSDSVAGLSSEICLDDFISPSFFSDDWQSAIQARRYSPTPMGDDLWQGGSLPDELVQWDLPMMHKSVSTGTQTYEKPPSAVNRVPVCGSRRPIAADGYTGGQLPPRRVASGPPVMDGCGQLVRRH